MTPLTRRSLLTGLAALVAAPAVIRTPGLLMPVKAFDAGWSAAGTVIYDTGYIVASSLERWIPLFFHDETGHLQSFVNGDINSVPKVWTLFGEGARHWVA